MQMLRSTYGANIALINEAIYITILIKCTIIIHETMFIKSNVVFV